MTGIDLLSMIDNVDVVTESAELDVMTSLMNVYMKEAQLIQEGFMDEVNAPIKGKEGESILKKILMFIPRLIAKIIRMITRLIQYKKRADERSSIRTSLELLAYRDDTSKESVDDFIKATGIELDKWYQAPGGFRYKYTFLPNTTDYGDALMIVCHGMMYDHNKMNNMDSSTVDDELNSIFKKHNVDSEYAKTGLAFYFDDFVGSMMWDIADSLQECADNMKKTYVERINNNNEINDRNEMSSIVSDLMRVRRAFHVIKNNRNANEFLLYDGRFKVPEKNDRFMNIAEIKKRLQNINNTFLIFKDEKVLDEIRQYCNNRDKTLDPYRKYYGEKWHERKSYDDFESSVSLFTETLNLFSAEIAFILTTRSKIDATTNAVLAQLKENKKEEIKRDVLNA